MSSPPPSPPSSTESLIVFSRSFSQFARQYNAESTDHRLSGEQVEQTFKLLEKALNEYYQSDCGDCCLCLFNTIALILCVCISVVTFLEMSFSKDVNFIMFGVFVVVLFFGCCVEQAKKKRLWKARSVCQYIIDTQNEKLAENKIRWVLPEHFPHWIELHIDFKKKSAPGLRIAQANPFGQQHSVGNQDLEQGAWRNYDSNAYNPPQQYH